MKTLKTLLSVFAIAAVFSTGALAQGLSDNANITATTEVVSSISAGNTGNLNFGTILSSALPSIASDSSAAGYVQFTGATLGAGVDISVTYPTTLDPQDSQGGSFDFTPTNLGIDENNAAAPSSGSISVKGVSTGYSHTVADNGINTNFFVTVGGALSNPTSIANGTYSGTITITASYQ